MGVDVAKPAIPALTLDWDWLSVTILEAAFSKLLLHLLHHLDPHLDYLPSYFPNSVSAASHCLFCTVWPHGCHSALFKTEVWPLLPSLPVFLISFRRKPTFLTWYVNWPQLLKPHVSTPLVTPQNYLQFFWTCLFLSCINPFASVTSSARNEYRFSLFLHQGVFHSSFKTKWNLRLTGEGVSALFLFPELTEYTSRESREVKRKEPRLWSQP